MFEEATADARKIGGRKVAFLSLNDYLFERYLKASWITGKHVPLTTREGLKGVQYARGRRIFSMPEYVAGLLFDAVYLLHVHQSDLGDEVLRQGLGDVVSKSYVSVCAALRQSDDVGIH